MTSIPDPNAKIRMNSDAIGEFDRVAKGVHRVGAVDRVKSRYFCGHEVVLDETAQCVAFDVGVLPHTRAQFLALIAPNGVSIW